MEEEKRARVLGPEELFKHDAEIRKPYEELLEWAIDTLVELNVSNYTHDDVCRANDASVEVILALLHFLGKK